MIELKTSRIPPKEEIESLARLFAAINDPMRRKIVLFIDQFGKVNVEEIQLAVNVEQTSTSYHLRVLRDAGLVMVTPDGTFRWYSLNEERFIQISEMISIMSKK